MKFEEALTAMRNGAKVTCSHWNQIGSDYLGHYIYLDKYNRFVMEGPNEDGSKYYANGITLHGVTVIEADWTIMN